MKNSPKFQFTGLEKVNPILRKKNLIKTLDSTLEIEEILLGEEKIITILDRKRILRKVIKKLKNELMISRVVSLNLGHWKINHE